MIAFTMLGLSYAVSTCTPRNLAPNIFGTATLVVTFVASILWFNWGSTIVDQRPLWSSVARFGPHPKNSDDHRGACSRPSDGARVAGNVGVAATRPLGRGLSSKPAQTWDARSTAGSNRPTGRGKSARDVDRGHQEGRTDGGAGDNYSGRWPFQ